ncbi:MAG: glutamate-cysteine ligase family protein [Oligoflexales bacterium]
MTVSSPSPSRLCLDECFHLVESQCFSALGQTDRIGLELEMLVTKSQESIPLPKLQELLQENLPLRPVYDGDVVVALSWKDQPEAGALTFEPGGQLEIATEPEASIQDVEKTLKALQNKLDTCFEPHGIQALQVGTNPWEKAEKIGLRLAKSRYKAMDRHFQNIGPWGRVMMRQTMTVQVCLDFGPDQESMLHRYLASQLISPFAAAMFANSTFLNGKQTDNVGTRTQSWYELDKTRTGYPGLDSLVKHLHYKTCVQSYVDAVLDARVVYIAALQYENPDKPITMREWIRDGYKGVYPEQKDFEQHLSLMFPEVRPKGFLELRSVDGQLRSLQMMPAAFFVGLLYDKNNVHKTLEVLQPEYSLHAESVFQARFGLENDRVARVTQILCQLAMEGLERQGFSEYREKLELFYERYTSQRLTPANDVLKWADGRVITDKKLNELDAWWQNRIQKGKL